MNEEQLFYNLIQLLFKVENYNTACFQLATNKQAKNFGLSFSSKLLKRSERKTS